MRVLVVNVGSSSIKLSLLDHDDTVVLSDHLPADASDAQIEHFLAAAGRPDAIGHRIVHGGPNLEHPVQIDRSVLAVLDDAARLAPLHDPPAISMVRRLRHLHPEVPAVACFDTTFHRSIDPSRRTYAIPAAWRDAGVRRYGFHGLSYRYASRRAGELLGSGASTEQAAVAREDDLRLVICHLGAGASACATEGGVSRDTTMGFTPVEGLVMATRSGDVDPGALMWLQQELDLTAAEMERALNHESGLLGLADTADMAEVVRRRAHRDGPADGQPTGEGPADGQPTGEGTDAGDRRRTCADAALAFDIYVVRVAKAVAAMVVTLGNLDALVFTGGVGEHAPDVRAEVVSQLGFLDIGIDPAANEAVDVDAVGDADITDPSARIRTLVLRAREDLEIASETRTALGPHA